MSDAWFYMPELPAVGEKAELDPAEARHAQAARRLKAGDAVTLFNGRGDVADAIIADIARQGRLVRVEARAAAKQPQPNPAVHLAAALPKGDRQATLLSMATQLGMASFIPLQCERSVASGESGGFRERSLRVCIEACKQSRRAHLPEIREAMTPAQAASHALPPGAIALVAHPGGQSPAHAAPAHAAPADAALLLLIGPEGGWTDSEMAAMTAGGAKAVALGDGILRTETAAIALLAWARLRSV